MHPLPYAGHATALGLSAWPHVGAGLLPVCLFLVGLVVLDSYKLVRIRAVGAALLAGMAAAGLCFFLQTHLLAVTGMEFRHFSRYAAPVIEELAKSVYLIFLIRSHRIGFQVDAAILGFATGTGFALAENAYYLATHETLGLFTWILRGLGTAVMHGGTACLFAIISKMLHDRSERPGFHLFLAGYGVAVALHALFNHFLLPPLLTTALIVLVFPALIVVVFHQSERFMREWLGSGFDTDQALLDHLTYGNLDDDRVGRYLQELKDHFPGEVVADMLCLLRLRAELSITAKGMLMMREAGFRMTTPPHVRNVLEEIRFLEHSIGATGLLALAPVLHSTSRDFWQLHLLKTN